MNSNVCRVRLATTWMNEEWYNDQVRQGIDRDWVRFPFASTSYTYPIAIVLILLTATEL
jgi:hypothetical protein